MYMRKYIMNRPELDFEIFLAKIQLLQFSLIGISYMFGYMFLVFLIIIMQ